MEEGKTETAFEWLSQMYLPGYMTLDSEDYDGRSACFKVRPVEPQVTVLSDKYLTPRGTHIIVSQASYCLFEQLVSRGNLPLTVDELRGVGELGRLKLVEFNQKLRKELPLSGRLEGRFSVTRLRGGAMPVVKMDFDLGNRAITGNLTGVIAPHTVVQANSDILRN